jgi:glycosyltransferase involved in cell wall biosynthesis
MAGPPKIGYVLKRFPRLSETFVLNEVLQLERLGTQIQIFSRVDPETVEPGGTRHKLLSNLAAQIIYLPDRLPLKGWSVRHGRFSSGKFIEKPWSKLCGTSNSIRPVSYLQAALVAAIASSHGIAHLHAHFASENATIACLASRLSGIPYSFTAHAKDIFHEDVDRSMLVQKIREARFVITVSDFNRRYLAGLAGENLSSKILRLYNGVDLERFRPDLSAPRESNLIVTVGRLEEKKGFHHLIRACQLLEDRKISFRCIMVGDGSERENLRREIVAVGLGDRVTLAGAQPQEELIDILRSATLFVLPSVVTATGDRDGLPTVLLEALGSGLPVISTTVAGIPEIIDDRKTGLLVPPGDPLALAAAIAELLDNAELRACLARAGRLKANKLFDIRQNVSVLYDFFVRSARGENCFLEHPNGVE